MYNKLFAKILDSSIWLEDDATRIVWITLLAAMDQDGYAAFSAVGNLANRARVTMEQAEEAVRVLESPDRFNPNQAHEGRRIERVPGGFLVLKAQEYSAIVRRVELLALNRERVRRHRAQKAAPTTEVVIPLQVQLPGHSGGNGSVMQSDIDVDADVRTLPTEGSPLPSAEASGKALRELWNMHTAGTGLPRCLVVSKARARKCQARLQEHPVLWHREAIQRLAASAFCRGENDRGWVASFDWYIHNEDNALKVLEGKYDNRAVVKGRTAGNQQALRDVLAAMGGSGDETGG